MLMTSGISRSAAMMTSVVAAWGAKKLEKYVAKKQKLEAEKKND